MGSFYVTYAQPACLTNSLIINTGYNPNTNTGLAMGVNDNFWQITNITPMFTLNNPAAAIGPSIAVPQIGVWLATSPNANWLSCFPNPMMTVTNQALDGSYALTFTRTFNTCIDDNLCLNFNRYAVDNYISNISLDATTISAGNLPTNNPISGPHMTNPNIWNWCGPVTAGTHVLSVTVVNSSAQVQGNQAVPNPIGLYIEGNITSQNNFNSIVMETNACAQYVCSPCVDTCYWKLNGDLAVAPHNFIGSINNADFKIRTDNQERMTIEGNGFVGINTINPTNRLEITEGSSGNSGLRLTNMPANIITPIANPGTGVLSVDNNGDVIYVPGGSGAITASEGLTINGSDVQLGAACGNSGGQFTINREINMNNNNLYFKSGPQEDEANGKLYAGAQSCPDLFTRLEISSAGISQPSLPSNSYSSPDPSLSGLRFTDLTMTTPTIPNQSEGVLSLDRDGDIIWVEKSAGGLVNNCSVTNIVPKVTAPGVLDCSQIFDNGTSVGVNTTSGFGYSWSGGLAGSTLPPTSGTIRHDVNGVVRGLAYIATSDENLKTNVENITNAEEIIRQIEGKKYSWKSDVIESTKVDDSKHYGFMAQELAKVVPEAVIVDENGKHGVNYDAIIPILVESQKKLMAKLDKQEKIIEELLAVEKHKETISELNIVLSDNNQIELQQNVPNPFTDNTSIGYFIPSTIKSAKIFIKTIDGKTIEIINIEKRGRGVVNIYKSGLSNGVYLYSLLVDGRVIDTKKMNYIK